jgi:hypothetical protein
MCADDRCECAVPLLPSELGAQSERCWVCCTWREYPDAPCLCEVLHEDEQGREWIEARRVPDVDAIEREPRQLEFAEVA